MHIILDANKGPKAAEKITDVDALNCDIRM